MSTNDDDDDDLKRELDEALLRIHNEKKEGSDGKGPKLTPKPPKSPKKN